MTESSNFYRPLDPDFCPGSENAAIARHIIPAKAAKIRFNLHRQQDSHEN